MIFVLMSLSNLLPAHLPQYCNLTPSPLLSSQSLLAIRSPWARRHLEQVPLQGQMLITLQLMFEISLEVAASVVAGDGLRDSEPNGESFVTDAAQVQQPPQAEAVIVEPELGRS